MAVCSACTYRWSDATILQCPMCGTVLISAATEVQRQFDLRTPFQCSVCTFVNEQGGVQCEACMSQRPAEPVQMIDRQQHAAALQSCQERSQRSLHLATWINNHVDPLRQQVDQIRDAVAVYESHVADVMDRRRCALQYDRRAVRSGPGVADCVSGSLARHESTRATCVPLQTQATELRRLIDQVQNQIGQVSGEFAGMLRSMSIDVPAPAHVANCLWQSAPMQFVRDWIGAAPAQEQLLLRYLDQLESKPDEAEPAVTEEPVAPPLPEAATDDADTMSVDTANEAARVSDPNVTSVPVEEDPWSKAQNYLSDQTRATQQLHVHAAVIYLGVTSLPSELGKWTCDIASSETSLSQIASSRGLSAAACHTLHCWVLQAAAKDTKVKLERMRLDRSLMVLHEVGDPFVTVASERIAALETQLMTLQSAAATAAALTATDPVDYVVTMWSQLPSTVQQSRLLTPHRLDEYNVVSESAGSIKMCSLHSSAVTLKSYTRDKFAELSADVSVRSALMDTCIYVAPINTIFVQDDSVWIESPTYKAGSLDAWLRTSPKEYMVRHVIILLLRAVADLHSRGVCHGNLRPEHILLTQRDYSPVLFNFAQARWYQHVDVRVFGGQSDTWSIAAILHQWCSISEAHPNGVQLVPGIQPQLPTQVSEPARELLAALLAGCSASSALDLHYCSGDIVADLITSRDLAPLTSDTRLGPLRKFLEQLPRRNSDLLVQVERGADSILYAVLTALETVASNDLLLTFRTKYSAQSSQGIDQGGLTTDLFTEFFLKVVSPDANLFVCAPDEDCPASGPSYLPSPDNHSMSFYAAVGKALSKQIIDGRVVPIMFSMAIIKFLIGIEPDLVDLYDYDRTMAHSFRNLLSDRTSLLSLCGTDMPLPHDRSAFVHDRIREFLIERRRPQLEAIRTGFYTLQGLKDQCCGVSAQDLRELLSGVQILSYSMIRSEIVFDDQWDESATPGHLQSVLQSYEEADLRRFLRLCTSLSCLPIHGLRRKITVKKTSSGVERLPVGHTCFHTLDMPDYNDRGVLESKLRTVLDHIDHIGFGYA